MPTIDKTALVISGGTAKGAYAAGLLHELFTQFPELASTVQIVSGTSTGSLIAPMLSLYLLAPEQNRSLLDLIVHRYEVASSKIFRDEPRTLLWRLVKRLARLLVDDEEQARMLAMLGETGATLDTSPLYTIISAEYTDARLEELFAGRDRVQCLVNCVSAQTGGVVFFSSTGPDMTAPVFRDAIYASCLQPIFMPLKTFTPPGAQEPQDYMDGGVRDVVPAYSAWRAGATRMLLLTLFQERDTWAGGGTFGGRENLLRLLRRVVAGLLDEEVEDDDVLQARYLATIGKLVGWATAHGVTGDELKELLHDLVLEEREHFSGSRFLDRLYVHRPPDYVHLVERFRWDAGQMAESIEAGRTVVREAEGQRMHDFLLGLG